MYFKGVTDPESSFEAFPIEMAWFICVKGQMKSYHNIYLKGEKILGQKINERCSGTTSLNLCLSTTISNMIFFYIQQEHRYLKRQLHQLTTKSWQRTSASSISATRDPMLIIFGLIQHCSPAQNKWQTISRRLSIKR